jgi:hypothetical protein
MAGGSAPVITQRLAGRSVTDCCQESVNEVERVNGEPFSCQIRKRDLFFRKQLRDGDAHIA